MCQAQLRYYVCWPSSFPQFLCDLGYETLRCITDTSNLNLCLKLSSRFPHTQIYFDAFPIKVFPLLGKVFPSLLSPSSQDRSPHGVHRSFQKNLTVSPKYTEVDFLTLSFQNLLWLCSTAITSLSSISLKKNIILMYNVINICLKAPPC